MSSENHEKQQPYDSAVFVQGKEGMSRMSVFPNNPPKTAMGRRS